MQEEGEEQYKEIKIEKRIIRNKKGFYEKQIKHA
jgi:hypothetical protein